MPHFSTMGRALSRRQLLVAVGTLGAGALASCTGSPRPARPTRSAPPTAPDPLLAVLAERQAWVLRYDAVGVAHPALLGRLQPLRAQTVEQVEALQLALALPTATTSPSTTSSSATADSTSGAPTAPVVPADPGAALAELRASVRAGAADAAALCLTVTVERAPLVGSLAAAGSCHDLALA